MMLNTIRGYYTDGQIILNDCLDLPNGQPLTLKIVELEGQSRKKIDWDSYGIRTDRGQNADAYMEEMRGNDRI